MSTIFKFLLITAMLSCLTQPISALDIPLGGGGSEASAIKIGYVDMEKIFQLYPKTQDAKQDYAKQLKAKRAELAKAEAELNAVKSKLTVLESTLKGSSAPLGASDVDAGTSTVAAVDDSNIDPDLENAEAKEPASITNLRAELEEKRVDFEERRKRAQDDLLAFERRQSQMILGNIYQALQDLAEEEQITIVVDKSSILYGATNIDLTDRLQSKVRGF
jgi:Skp family chaperone for outer membrane proteins